MAGIVILLNQKLGAHGLGNINPTLYGLAATPSLKVFHPVTTGNNNVYCQVGQPVARGLRAPVPIGRSVWV